MRKYFKKTISFIMALVLVIGMVPLSAIDTLAASWDLKNGGVVSSGQVATITCYGSANWQITNFTWDCIESTIATITGTDANGEVIYTREINGTPYIDKTFCYGGEQYVIDVIKGSVEIRYNTANTTSPKITVTGKELDTPTASAYDYILIETTTSDEDYYYVTVAYNLATQSQGAIMFGVESNNSGSYTILSELEHVVGAGVGRHTFTIPRELVTDEDIYVNISPYPHGDNWNPLDADKSKLDLTSSEDLMNQRENYYSLTSNPTFSILGSGENCLVGQDGYVVNYNGNQYTSSSNGRVIISDETKPTEDVLITKEGYYDHKIPAEVIRNFNQVYMYKDTVTEPYLENFYMRYNGSSAWENVQYNSIYFTEMSSQEYDIYISANWCGNAAMKVYLQQGDVKLELNEGFNEDVILGSSFSASGGKIYLCLETVGKTYKFTPKIYVDNYNLELDLDLGSQDETEISDDIQGVGGEKLKISCSMLDFLPVSVSMAADGTVTGTIGIKAEDKYQSTWYDEIKKSVSSHDQTKIGETFKKLKNADVPKWESKSSIGIGVDMSIIGYFTAHVVKESPNPDLVGTLQIDTIECAISIEGSVSASVQQFYGVVPVYWATELGLKLAFAFEMQKENPEANWEVQMPRLEIEISVSASGSLGINKIIGAGLKAKGSITITIHAPDYNFDSSSCYVEVTTYVIGEILVFKGEQDFWTSDKEYLWGEEYENSLASRQFSLFSDMSMYSLASLLDETEEPNDTVTSTTDDGVVYTAKNFDSLSYSNANIQTAELSNGKRIIVWVDSVDGREDINKAALYYSIYDPIANTYSNAKLVYDDGTADFTPQLTVGNNGVYLVWANISEAVSNETTLADYAALMDIAFIEYDVETDTFINYSCVSTENDTLDMIPYAAESNGEPYVVWVNDKSGNLLAPSDKVSLMAATYDGNEWVISTLQEDITSITSLVAVNATDGVDVYYTMDTDLDYSTGIDQELYRYAQNDVVQVTENEVPESDLSLVDGIPVWLSNGSATTLSGTNTNRMSANVYGTASFGDKTVTVYSEPSSTNSAAESIYAVFTSDGYVGVPIKIADTERVVRSIDVFFRNNQLQLYTTENSIIDGVIRNSAIMYYCVDIPDSIEICNTNYDDYSLKSNGELQTNVTLRNLSSNKIDRYLVSVYDEKIEDTRITKLFVPTAAGAKKTLKISIPIPSVVESSSLSFKIQPVYANGTIGESVEGTVLINPYDVSLEEFTAYQEDQTIRVSLSVVNRGIEKLENVQIKIYKVAEENQEIYSDTITSIDVDDTETVEFTTSEVALNDILYAKAISSYDENISINNELTTAVIETPSEDYEEIETDNILEVNIPKTNTLKAGESSLYAFIPEENGWYAFYSEGEADTYGVLFDKSMNQLLANDDDGDGSNFRLVSELVADETYFVKGRFYSTSRTGDLTITAIKLVPADSIVIEQGESIEGYPFESTSLTAYMTPEEIIPESYSWTSDDVSIATVNSSGYVSYKAPGTTYINVTSDNGLTDRIKVTVNEFPVIVLDETKTVDISTGGMVGYYAFTPESDGWYAFYSISNGNTYCRMYNSNGSQLTYDNNSGTDNNFRIEYEMIGGETYIFKSEYYSSSTTGSFDVKIEKMLAAESVSIIQGAELSGYIKESVSLTVDFSPVNCIEESISWTSSNETIATVNSYGSVSLLTPGDVEITATSENGLTDVITIHVMDYPTITLGEQQSVTITETQKNGYFYFTPERDGTYIYYSISDENTYGYLLDVNGSQLDYDNNSGDNYNFRIEYDLVAGTTYILKSKFYYSSTTGTFEVKIVEVVDAQSVEITNGNSVSGQVGSGLQLNTVFLPDGARSETMTWTSEDSNIASVSDTGYLTFVSEGTTTVTVTTANGLTDSCTIEVTGFPTIEIDEEIAVSTDENNGIATFKFIPEITGTYTFYSFDNDFDTYGYLYDSDMNQLTSDDDDGGSGNFKLSYRLEAGEVYYFRAKPYSSGYTGSYYVTLEKLPSATSIRISAGDSIQTYVDDQYYFYAYFNPSGSASESVTWTSNNESVATISSSGTLSCLAEGTAIITVTSENGLTDTCTVTVSTRPQATGIQFSNGTAITGIRGFDETLYVRFIPSESAAEEVTWSSSNESVATVDEYGSVSFLSAGIATITATSENGLIATCVVTVIEPVVIGADEEKIINTNVNSGIAFFSFTPAEDGDYVFYSYNNNFDTYGYIYDSNMSVLRSDDDSGEGNNFKVQYSLTAGTTYYLRSRPYESGAQGTYAVKVAKLVPATSVAITYEGSLSGYVGNYVYLNASLLPMNAISESFTWSSDNESVATVSNNGYVSFVSAGTANITVTTSSGFTDTCTVTVNSRPAATEMYITDSLSGLVGFDGSIYVYFEPDGCVSETVTWVSDNESVATVDEYGNVTYVSEGTATITATSENGLTDTCVVHVKSCPIVTTEQPVTVSITDNVREFVKFVPTESATYRVYSNNHSNYNSPYFVIYNSSMSWMKSGNNKVDYDFVAGETYYIATNFYAYSDDSGSFDLNVAKLVDAESIVASEDSLIGYEGLSGYRVIVTFMPENSRVENIVWSSSNTSVCTIDYDGNIVFVSEGTATITATSANGLVDSFDVTVRPATSIQVGDTKIGTIESGVQGYNFKFIPNEDGVYRFVVDADSSNTTSVRDAEGNWITSGYDYDFTMETELEAGKTYYIVTNYWNDNTGNYTLAVEKLVPATGVGIDVGSEFSGFVGTSTTFSPVFTPDNAIPESVTWSSNNTNVATVDEYGQVSLIAEGSAVITVMTESGLTASCTVTVTDFPTILLGQDESVTLDSTTPSAYFYFTPGESGYYAFYSFDNDADTYGYIMDSDMNVLDGDDDGGDGLNFKAKYQLEAGVTYILRARFLSEDRSGTFSVRVEQTKFITDIEILSNPKKTEYVEGFVTNVLDYSGLKLKITWSDNTTSELKYGNGWEVDGEYINVDTSSADETGEVIFSNGEASATLVLNVVENPVDHIEIHTGTSKTYVKDYNGYTTNNGDSDFFYYYTELPSDAVIKVVYKDGTSVTGNVGSYIDGYYISWENNQYTTPWTLGTENQSIVSYLGKTVVLPITVKENTVESIEVVAGSLSLIENAEGYMDSRYDDETDDWVDYFYYDFFEIPSDTQIKINYSDGTSKTVGIFEKVDGYYFNRDSNQDEKPWTLGSDNSITISYLGITTTMPVTIVENPIDYIEINTAPSRVYVYGDSEYGNSYQDGEYYFHPTDLTGMVFTVHYKDGTQKTYTYNDFDTKYREIDGYGYSISYNEENPEVGNFPVEFTYMGNSATYNVTLEASTVSSIEVTKAPNDVEFENGYEPDFVGMEITISYTDNTSKVVTLSKENIEYVLSNNYSSSVMARVNVDGYYLSIYMDYDDDNGTQYYVVEHLSAFDNYNDIVFTEKKDISSIEVENPGIEGNNSSIKITYDDETSETLNLKIVHSELQYKDDGFAEYGIVAETEKGMLSYWITVYYDDESNIEEYYYYILGEEVKIEVSNDVIIGDVNGDGFVDSIDRLVLTRYLADWEGYEEETINMAAADVNADGFVDSVDRLVLTRYLADWEGYESLPCVVQ